MFVKYQNNVVGNMNDIFYTIILGLFYLIFRKKISKKRHIKLVARSMMNHLAYDL